MSSEGPIVAEGVRERAERALLCGAMALPAALKRRIAGPAVVREGQTLDLDTQLLLRIRELDPEPPLREVSLPEARARLRRSAYLVSSRPAPVAELREIVLEGAATPLRARLYVPAEAAAAPRSPLVVYYHGGGWVVGDLDTHEHFCRALAQSAGARVLSVEYRLAPEHPFPAAVEDALAAFREAVARAEELGADATRIALAGDSAGGHLAAVSSLLARADPQPPAFQLLIYPATDCAETSASRSAFGEGFFLTKDNMDFYEECFLAGADRWDPRISPLHAEDLAGLPPALVVTAGFDPLRDEGEAYALRLRDAGVPVVLRRHAGFIHGFTHFTIGGSGPREAVAEMGGVLRGALAAGAVHASQLR